MSSLKNRPSEPPRARSFDTPSKGRKILSMAIRYGIANNWELTEYNFAQHTNDWQQLQWYHEIMIPYYKEYLKVLFVKNVS